VPRAPPRSRHGLLGASKWKNHRLRHRARPRYRGILTAVLLAFARVAGENRPAPVYRAWQSILEAPGLATTHCFPIPVMIFTYALAPYDDWHRQAWAAGPRPCLGLILIINIVARAILSRGIAVSKDLTYARFCEASFCSVNIPPHRDQHGGERDLGGSHHERMTISRVNFFYTGAKQVLFDISMGIATNKGHLSHWPLPVAASPPCCAPLNRMHEAVRQRPPSRAKFFSTGQNILTQDVTAHRRRVGMV